MQEKFISIKMNWQKNFFFSDIRLIKVVKYGGKKTG